MTRPATRSARTARTREALIRAGIDLFLEQGIDGPSLDAICQHAGFTRGAFYVHFENREHFLEIVLQRLLGSYTTSIVETADPAGDLERSLRDFVHRMDGAHRGVPEYAGLATPHLGILLQGIQRSERLRELLPRLLTTARERLSTSFRAGQESGTFRGDVDADAISQILTLAALGIVLATQTGTPHDAISGGETLLTLLQKNPA